MAEVSEKSKGPAGAYELTYEPDDSSFTVRENLVDILERELLGPIHGPDELLPFSPRSQYLVGHIAPVRLSGAAAGGPDSGDNTERGELVEPRADVNAVTEVRGVPAPPTDEHEADSDDDDPEDRAPKQGLMIPSSMGLRFQVPPDLESFTVTASWGTYESVQTDKVTKGGRPIRHFQRIPVEEPRSVRLADLKAGQTTTIPLRDTICLRVDRFDDPSHNRVLIEIALCNDRETPMPIPIGMWMFQTKLYVDAGGEKVFLPVRDVLEQAWPEHDPEVQRLNLQYRNRLEYAIGRTCSADWTVKKGSRRASAVWTTWLPVAETPQTQARDVENALLSMDALATATADQVRTGLGPLIAGYGEWLDTQEATAAELPNHLRETADLALLEGRRALKRLQDGLAYVVADAEALRCFQFMNAVMRDQRIASQVAAMRASDPGLSISDAQAKVAETGPKAASWRPFQLAFILMQLGALTDPSAPLRSAEHLARVELLFFPTGGGKTEAYLGLAAYTFAIRRRQGIVESADGPLDGRDGVAVLMRYTLRLLTAQQFQRATTLVCAAELVRQADETTWGTEPFRIGLWVGTDVSPKRFEEADEQLTKANEYGAHRLTVLQVQRCPWCGTPITASQVKADATARRVFVYCGDDLARCPFSKGGQVSEGLPILTVDEEIYRLTPAFVIATVDKFARLAREGEAAALFGYVGRRCGRHGYVHPDYAACNISTAHPAVPGYPTATVHPVKRLRPPDLIIQDELHLITGALGTAVGLFEVAVETLASWEGPDGKPVRPLIVASTATVRNAQEQVRGLYGRRVEIFPPQVLDVSDTYFSREISITEATPGRRYVGVSAQGVRLASAEIRVSEVLLSAGQLLLDRSGIAADPYMTLVGYFNATRELAGMTRYMGDDVQNRVKRPRKDSGFPPRHGAAFGLLNSGELTARIASSEIGRTLDRLGLEFDPDYDTTEAFQARMEAQREGRKVPTRKEAPFDVVLATSMLQVGVDVQRLGLMLVVGQPKNTAEYIQASSRVGRDPKRPGLVVTLGNWARPRDLAHFEQFRHYHETFYSQVEALSVTPYSPTSLDRGLDGLLVSVARVVQAPLDEGLSQERNAWRIKEQRATVDRAAERLKARVAAAALDEAAVKYASDRLVNRIDRWADWAGRASDMHKTLVYERTGDGDKYLPLLMSPENAKADAASSTQPPFVVANSMREVQPEINILVSPIPDRLFTRVPEGAPRWTLPVGDDD
ncbi:helicase [Mycolicibacterium pulveris]|uniref:Helicase n=1 Tax=Mycolicibacterium pulveris TaxID=36813 RepID=A0A7I7UGZ8_MYCPV|nr:DISARM system helicase DrmA [Mycolicibacterium pulveris]MCV6978648.1 helicase [Mycolicibacterium pulveris]BBY80161.1 helicase [Mycolicibacterium pulveris]